MTTRKLGNSDLQITPIGFGAWAAGGGNWEFSWGPQDDRESIAAIHKALELGVNWIDTAAVYGLGHSEEIVAQALKEWRGARPYVFTKCVLAWDASRKITPNHSAASIRRECEGSLKRLGVETIDLYQIHWPPSDNGPGVEESWQTLSALQKEGNVRWIGVSNFNVAQMERCAKIAPITSQQPPYSAVSPEVEKEILPYCRSHNIGVIVYSPMKSGLLTGKMTKERVAAFPPDDFRRKALNYQEPHLSRNLELAEIMKGIAARHGRSAGEVAIAWVLRNPAVTAAIVGMRSAEQVQGVIGAMEFRLSEAEIAEIEAWRTAPAAR